MQSINVIVALPSAFCGHMLRVMALTLYSIDKGICAFLLIISNVEQNVNLIFALHSALCGSNLAVIAFPGEKNGVIARKKRP